MEKTKVQELEILNEYYNRGKNQILIVYGHLRTGSESVIKAFAEDKEHLYYCACSASERLQRFIIGERLRDGGYDIKRVPTYREIMECIEKIAIEKNKPITVFVENFEDIMKVSPDFLEEINPVLYNNNHPQITVVLMGSNSAWIENNMVEKIGAQATYITGFLKIKPYSFQEMRRRFSKMSDKDAICTYSIFGGKAQYWEYFDENKTFKQNVCDKFLDEKNSVLLRETSYLLEENLRETAVYNTILFGLANGKNKLNDIHHATGFSRAKIMVYLKSLIELGIVEKVYSFATTGHENVQKGVYRICDPLANFYFRFLYKNLSQIIRMPAEKFYDEYIEKYLPEYVIYSYRLVCKEYIMKLSEYEKLPFTVEEEGEWVGKIDSLDIVAQSDMGDTLVGLCSWDETMDINILELIRNCCKKARLNPDYYYLFSAVPFDEGLVNIALTEPKIRLIGLEEMMNA